MVMAAPPPVMRPFPLTTRYLLNLIDSKAFAPGGANLDFPIDRYDYLDALVVHLSGTFTVVTGTPNPKAGFPWNIVARFVLDTPGLADPIAQSGDSMHHQNLLSRDFSMDTSGGDFPVSTSGLDPNAYYAATLVNVAPVAVAANTWHLWWVIPTARNIRDLRGLVPVGNRTRSRLRVTPGALADIVATTANVSATNLTCAVYQASFTAQPAGQPGPDTSFAVVYDEYSQPIAGTGQVKVEIPLAGRILNIAHRIFFVDTTYPPAPEGSILDVSLWLDRQKVVDKVPFEAFAFAMQKRRQQPLPAGTVVHDFDYLQDDVPFLEGGQELGRNWVYSDELTEMSSLFTVAGGTTLTNAKVITSVKRLARIS